MPDLRLCLAIYLSLHFGYIRSSQLLKAFWSHEELLLAYVMQLMGDHAQHTICAAFSIMQVVLIDRWYASETVNCV